jgi:DNA invertase Pin-like site-specific DNA recombinase
MTVEQAFNRWEGIKTNCTYTEEDNNDMRKMRASKMSYKEIGEVYGISAGAVHKRVNGYYKKNRSTAMVAAN